MGSHSTRLAALHGPLSLLRHRGESGASKRMTHRVPSLIAPVVFPALISRLAWVYHLVCLVPCGALREVVPCVRSEPSFERGGRTSGHCRPLQSLHMQCTPIAHCIVRVQLEPLQQKRPEGLMKAGWMRDQASRNARRSTTIDRRDHCVVEL